VLFQETQQKLREKGENEELRGQPRSISNYAAKIVQNHGFSPNTGKRCGGQRKQKNNC